MVIYSSPFGNFPPSTVPVHEIILRRIEVAIADEPGRKAFISGSDPSNFFTFTQLRDQALSVSQFLHDRGFVKQTACTVVSNCFEYLPFFIGVAKQGGTLTGASAAFNEAELRRQFEDSQCTVILTDSENVVKTMNAARGLSSIKTIIVLSTSSVPLKGTVSWNEVIKTKYDKSRKPVEINVKDDVALLPYSSGTTGIPKGVMLTHQSYGTMLNIICKLREAVMLRDGRDPEKDLDTQILLLPFYHVYGFTVLCASVLCKCTSILLPKFKPEVLLRSIQDYKITHISIVPPILVFLAKDPLCDKYDLTSLKGVSCGAAAAGKVIVADFRKRYPHVEFIKQGYGMTELSTASHISDAGSWKKNGSCGKLAPGMQMKIVDTETGRELDQGETGEICVRGITIMKGYLGKDQATKDTIRDGWLHTGDIGYCDTEGDLFIVDRMKELIKVKGLQVPPAEIEAILLSHPLIVDAAVIGIPNDRSGELPKAFVVRTDTSLTEQLVFDYVKERVSAYKQLKGGIEFIDKIPKSEAGKILRRVLRDRMKSKI